MNFRHPERRSRLASFLSATFALLMMLPLPSRADLHEVAKDAFQLDLNGSASDSGPFHLCTGSYTVPDNKHLHVSRVSFVGSSAQAQNAALGGQVFVGSALVGALTPPGSGPFNNPPYVLAFYGNQEADVDVDAGGVLYILFQFTQSDSNLLCNIVIAGYLIDK
jgi:hypothetical protein